MALDPRHLWAAAGRTGRAADRQYDGLYARQRRERSLDVAHECRYNAGARLLRRRRIAVGLRKRAILAVAGGAGFHIRPEWRRDRWGTERLRRGALQPAGYELAARLLWHRRHTRAGDYDRGGNKRLGLAGRLLDRWGGAVGAGGLLWAHAPALGRCTTSGRRHTSGGSRTGGGGSAAGGYA